MGELLPFRRIENPESAAGEEAMPSQPADPPALRLCENCLFPKPLEDFRLRHRAGAARMRQCRECHNTAERMRRAARRNRLNRRQLAKMLTAIKNQRSDLQVKALCWEMASQFGGVAGIVQAWRRSLDKDLAKGGYPAFRHLAAILRLSQYCEQNKPDYSAMSDEELESAIWELGGPLSESE